MTKTTKFWIKFPWIVLKDTESLFKLTNVFFKNILMEIIVYGFLFIVLFIGVIFNLKITNSKKVYKIKNKLSLKSRKEQKWN